MLVQEVNVLKLTYSLLLLLTTGFVTSALVRHEYLSHVSPARLQSRPVETILADDVPQVISVQVTPSGFEPRETIAPRGRFLMLLQNRTGRRDLNFWLARENEGRVAESKPQNRDWKAQLQLTPGTYIIGETNHPEWQSVIRVTN